jgi:putative zinc finger/helix-turn-helix YgiT family protein
MTTAHCAICGSDELNERHGTYVFDWPEGYAEASSGLDDATWQECARCGEHILPPALIARIEAERYRMEGLLSPIEVREARTRIGLTQIEMARLLGVGDKTYTRWELGLSTQTKSMDNLVRLADQHPEVLLEIEAQRRPQRRMEIAAYVRSLGTSKANSDLALAAHGGELDAETAARLRQRLREIAGKHTDAG